MAWLARPLAPVVLALPPLICAGADMEAPPLSGQTNAAAISESAASSPANPEHVKGKEYRKPKLQSALTLVTNWGPDYMGSSHQGLGVRPGFLVRYGRWTLSSNGSFAANPDKDEDQPRGLTFNTFGDDNDWVRLSLRIDSGRRSKGVDGLSGIDDVPRTVRMRISAHIDVGGGWALTPGANIDLLNRGVGHTLDMNLSRDWMLAPRWKLTTNTGLTWGNRQYMRSYFGVTREESVASGYAPYEAKAGFRDVWVGTGLRYDINPRWVATANVSAQRLLGPAADTPITRSRTSWGAGAGVGWRF
jgi:outer membrane protein